MKRTIVLLGKGSTSISKVWIGVFKITPNTISIALIPTHSYYMDKFQKSIDNFW